MAFYPRGTWGGRTPSAGSLGQVNTIAIHHSASAGAPAGFDPARWQALEAGEVARGYSSLAYNFGVTANGDQVEIRGWGQKGAATGGRNSDTVAIVFDGYFHSPYNDQPTEAALNAAADLIVLGVYLGFIAGDFNCQPHSVLCAGTQWATACPGDSLRGLVNGFGSIEARAKAKIQGAPAGPITPAPEPPAQPRCESVCAKRVLRRGSSGVCVKTLQRLLAQRGFNPGAQDGKFGQATRAAVKCFQGANNLQRDGVVGPATWAVLGS